MQRRIQLYVVVFGAYYLYKTYIKGPDSSGGAGGGSSADAAGKREQCTDDPEARRRFGQGGDSWLSYLEAGSCSNTQLVLLHQTALSAETEFGAAIPRLLTAAPAGGLKVLAVDRLCHGYSSCQEGGEAAQLASLLARRPAGSQTAYVASGRDAAGEVFDLVQRRKVPARILLLRPHLASLDDRATMGVKSPRAAAFDSARWSTLGSKASKQSVSLDASSLPRGCTVTLIYLDADEEDNELAASLEDNNVPVEVRHADLWEEDIVPAVADMLAVDGAATEETIDHEV